MKKILIHPNSEILTKEIDIDGGSGGALFLGALWYAVHGLWGKFCLYLLLSVLAVAFTMGIGLILLGFIMAFRFNKERYEFLLEKGYKEKPTTLPNDWSEVEVELQKR